MAEINKDLVRWKRSRWLAVIGAVFLAQLAAILFGSQKAAPSRVVYPDEPLVALGKTTGGAGGLAEEIENPFLFAAASVQGFSGTAWLQMPDWEAPEIGRKLPPRFLSFEERRQSRSPQELGPFAFLKRGRPAAVFPEVLERPAAERASELRIEGLAKRKLVTPLALPVQYHTDVLRQSAVEVLVGADGLVISAHLLENSGSPKADAEALALARTARFTPVRGTNRTPELGKLIFQWHALDLSATNRVNGGSNSVVQPR